ncbi:helix-turn-helix domain-containing protein [Propionimicrobium lymphophilum]|uniref:helix-turn-helix domain-containing protein n=1 Tax=Propionimicrobium lymphophilum TaxID=33012 RepID=UPI0023F1A15D|nr:helix-turn-helix transcriptional regulator [Propionimicrobium lymphophilum]MDV6239159.1 helix-turn-helix transcriptional regulator [Trueperella bernardiae]
MNDCVKFGEFVAERRKQHGYTMRKFADMIGVTAPYLSDIEKGRRAAPDGKLEEIAAALRLSRVERERMFDLAALTRDNQVSADLTGYIMDRDLARVALRRAKERDLSDSQWRSIIDIIEGEDLC